MTGDANVDPPAAGARHDLTTITQRISEIGRVRGTGPGWLAAFAVSFALTMVLLVSVTWLFVRGVGIWGVNVPVGWGFAITNFVWWIGIGHAGTLISAVLLLARQTWRRSINRFAEAMTLFAVACAGLFPLLHMGRPSLFYWLLPYPNTMDLWPQFRSPLVWDVAAISVYALVSLLFWFLGLVPDLATMRDRARSRAGRVVYGILALGWRGSAAHWHRYELGYLLLAGLATPLVVSVHSIVGLDFAVSIEPGWHSTLFPPYFVAGALFSGLAMVLTIAIPLRAIYGLRDLITDRHLNAMAKIMLGMGLLVAYGYVVETFMVLYRGDEVEIELIVERVAGSHAPAYWSLIAGNVVVPQVLWSKRVRRSPVALFVVALVVNIGMWLERFIIVVTGLERDFLPSSWGTFEPTIWDWSTLLGSLGLFAALLLLFIRLLPVMSMHEMRELVAETQAHGPEGTGPEETGPEGTGTEGTGTEGAGLQGSGTQGTGLAAEPPGAGAGAAAAAAPPGERASQPSPGEASDLIAEFASASELLAAARAARDRGHSRMDAFSPYPVDGLTAVLGTPRRTLPAIVLAAGVVGAAGGFLMQYYATVNSYPMNVGGRPDNSWPAYVPLTFEVAILCAALAAVVGFLVSSKLPQPYHPVFAVPGFQRASQDRFFLAIEARDPAFDADATRELLQRCGAAHVREIAP